MHLVLSDRIFISEDIERERIYDKWMGVDQHMCRDFDLGKFRIGVDEVRMIVLETARGESKQHVDGLAATIPAAHGRP